MSAMPPEGERDAGGGYTMSTRLLLIRHGETAWNAEHRIQGQLDIPLSSTGIRQSARLADVLSGEDVDAVYSSHLARARLTAAPVAERHGLDVVMEPRLRERSFGHFEGLTLDEIAQRHPEDFERWRARDPQWRLEGGESGQQLIERVLDAISDIAARHVGGTAVLISHGGVLDVVYRAARSLEWHAPREHQMLNAAINCVIAETAPLKLSIERWSDAAHLHESRDELLA